MNVIQIGGNVDTVPCSTVRPGDFFVVAGPTGGFARGQLLFAAHVDGCEDDVEYHFIRMSDGDTYTGTKFPDWQVRILRGTNITITTPEAA